MGRRIKDLAMSTFLLSWLLLLAAPAQQTTTPNPGDLCTIQGVVVKAGTGEPLHKATVEARPAVNRTVNGQSEGGTAETDAMGRFELKGLAPGRYHLSAERNGFVTQQYGQRTPDGPGAMLTLSSGQKIPDITFQMIPAVVISGHVYDEDGEPVVYAQVIAMHYTYINGQRQLAGNEAGQTNDLGEFRLFGLSPGQYFVQATLRSNRSENAKTRQGYVPIYYPGVSDASRAAPISVRGGDEFSGIDISLQPVRALTVRGNVLNAGCGDTARGATVFLREQNPYQNFGWLNPIRSANAQGAFEISNVIPGSYYLYAMLSDEGKQCFGRQPMEVADVDIDGVTLTVAPGVEIKGHLRAEGQTDSNLGSLAVNLVPKITFMPFGGGGAGATKSDGSFLLKNVSDGDYEINVENLPENSFVKSARLDGVDVLTAGVTVDTKQAPGSLDIMVSANGANVDGVVSKDQQPFPGATVALVPDPPHRGEKRLFKSTTTDQNGHFVVQGISPGDYKVFAWEKIEPRAYTSSEFLQPYENLGESVHVTEGSRNSVQVDLIPAKEADQ
jgi:protocatechuate 3,4-dioxygenase beta subunit